MAKELGYTQEEYDSFLADCYDNDLYFFKNCLTVRDHDTSQLLPFQLNHGQRILHNIAEKQKKELGRVRILLLKSRRFGGSTYVEGRFYKKTSLDFNRNCFIVGHEEKSTTTLFRMAQLFQEKNPLQPSVLASNAQELRFDVKPEEYKKGRKGLKSEYQLATAKNLGAGRSQGVHFLHASEEAFWGAGAEELLLGLFQCVPKPPAYSEIIRESTANGFGNTFQEAVFDAYCGGQYPYYIEGEQEFAWKNPDSDWILVFIPWNVVEKYSMPIPKDRREAFEKKINSKVFDPDQLKWVDSEESQLKEKFKLTLEQLFWRDWTIENDCKRSVEKFRQEFPLTVAEAFLSTGTNVFDKQLCDQLESSCKEPILIGDVYRLSGRSRIKRNKYGKLSVWEPYQDGETYVITADIAGGLKQGQNPGVKRKKSDEPDKTNIDVWNHRTGNQAAQWNGHIDYDLVADQISMMGELYSTKNARSEHNLPPAVVELNNHGYSVVAGLKELNYPQFGNDGDEPGWKSNRRTKPQMVDSLRQNARDGGIIINSKATVAEMRTYIEEGGHFNAASGCNDDRVITAGIASEMIKVLPRKYNKKAQKRKSAVRFANLEPSYEPDYEQYQEVYA